jgi:hypothetical protein
MVTCYTVVPPTPTPTFEPVVSCYEVGPMPTPTLEMVVECYEAAPPLTPTPVDPNKRQEVLTDTNTSGDVNMDTVKRVQTADARERLRDCWYQFDGLAELTAQDFEKAEKQRDDLVVTHRAVLDELVSLDELDEAVAALVHETFEEGAYHVWRVNAPITCYIALPIQYDPREDIIRRAEALSEVSGDVDPKVVAEAQEALARDIAFFGAFSPQGSANEELIALWQAGDIETGDQVLQAARFLGELLSRGAS